MPEPVFEITKDKQGKYRFRLRASNNELIATGEAYESKQSCEKGIETIKRIAPGAQVKDLTKAAKSP